MVKKGSVFTTVRRGDKKILQLCKAHPFCKYGDDCRYAHSELELKFWKGVFSPSKYFMYEIISVYVYPNYDYYCVCIVICNNMYV